MKRCDILSNWRLRLLAIHCGFGLLRLLNMGRKASTTAPERDHDLCWRIPQPAFVESVVNNNIQQHTTTITTFKKHQNTFNTFQVISIPLCRDFLCDPFCTAIRWQSPYSVRPWSRSDCFLSWKKIAFSVCGPRHGCQHVSGKQPCVLSSDMVVDSYTLI